MIRKALIAIALVGLTACDGGSAPKAPPTANGAAAQTDRELIARIAALPPGQLDIVLFRAIRDAGQECQGIAASRRIEDQSGRPAWSAQCDRGGQFLLVLKPDGQMTVTRGEAFGRR